MPEMVTAGRPEQRPDRFRNRQDAGRELAAHLQPYRSRRDVIVLGLPRGGVPVAYEVARALGADLDVFVVRKVGMPGHREYAIGALASGGVLLLDQQIIDMYRVPTAAVDAVIEEEREELERRERQYRHRAAPLALRGRTVILVDDGLATGSTMKAAVQAVRQHSPARVVVASPVGAAESCQELAAVADEVVCARTPEPFAAVGLWYDDFSQTSDQDVEALLQEHGAAASRDRR